MLKYVLMFAVSLLLFTLPVEAGDKLDCGDPCKVEKKVCKEICRADFDDDRAERRVCKKMCKQERDLCDADCKIDNQEFRACTDACEDDCPIDCLP